MTKKDLADVVYNVHGGLSRKEAANVVENVFDVIKTSLTDGDKVQISRFGVFEVHLKNSRKGVNPLTGEHIDIPSHKAIIFRPSNFLKKSVDEQKQ
jgi:integration host factor subunit alpha